jgi:hypothetical protein
MDALVGDGLMPVDPTLLGFAHIWGLTYKVSGSPPDLLGFKDLPGPHW